MPSLRDLQSAFASAVLGTDSHCMAGLIVANGFSTEERLSVYRNNARIGFHNALRAAYPVIEKLGGVEWFESAALRYQQQQPSRCGDLQYVGDRFAQFLQSDLAGTRYQWFSEIARLEWAYQEVLVAAASPVLDPGELATITAAQQEQLILMPRTEMRLIESPLPVFAIWQANQPGAGERDIALDAGASRVLLIRRTDHVELRELAADVAQLLTSLSAGLSLLQAQQQLAQSLPTADFGDCLRRLVAQQAFSSYRI